MGNKNIRDLFRNYLLFAIAAILAAFLFSYLNKANTTIILNKPNDYTDGATVNPTPIIVPTVTETPVLWEGDELFTSPEPPLVDLIPAIDFCSNIVGDQYAVPGGYYRVASTNQCYIMQPIDTPVPTVTPTPTPPPTPTPTPIPTPSPIVEVFLVSGGPYIFYLNNNTNSTQYVEELDINIYKGSDEAVPFNDFTIRFSSGQVYTVGKESIANHGRVVNIAIYTANIPVNVDGSIKVTLDKIYWSDATKSMYEISDIGLSSGFKATLN